MKLREATDEYFISHDYSYLREETKAHYAYLMGVALGTKVEGKPLSERRCDKISTRMAKQAYNQWCTKGIHMANHLLSTIRIVFNYAVHMELCIANPFVAVKKRTPARRKTVWTKEQVKKFLDTAYSDFDTRNIGLIAQMAYEWCQRLGDMRVLKWSNIDFERQTVYIEQSKRRAEVFLPISDDLYGMLAAQQEDFGFQEYVAPSVRPQKGVYKPYTLTHLPRVAKMIRNKAGLPDDLRLSDLRRTGTTEMVEAGVSMGNIMSVTGHANPQSVKPYMKNTLASANLALTQRQNRDKSTVDAAKEEYI